MMTKIVEHMEANWIQLQVQIAIGGLN